MEPAITNLENNINAAYARISFIAPLVNGNRYNPNKKSKNEQVKPTIKYRIIKNPDNAR
jgi:hypothetical protein